MLASFNLFPKVSNEAVSTEEPCDVMHNLIASAQLHFMFGSFGLGVLVENSYDNTMFAMKVIGYRMFSI